MDGFQMGMGRGMLKERGMGSWMGEGRKRGLVFRLAASSFRRNGTTYLPYLAACAFSVFVFFVFSLIINSDVSRNLPRVAYATMLLVLGQSLLCLIMVPFLCYTNSFLMKRRKRELGLYRILGMERKHIGWMIFWEALFVLVLALALGIGMGLLFAKMLFLVLLNLARLPLQATLSYTVRPFLETAAYFGVIMLLNLAWNLVQVYRVRPLELEMESAKGEKEVKHLGLWSLAGLFFLCAGYGTVLGSQFDSGIFNDFFCSVLFVVIGTYFLFTSGSVRFLKTLKGRHGFYYRAENFITINGLLGRMKKNAAGMANICIFSTMAIITLTCTVSLYLGVPSIMDYRYPYKVQAQFLPGMGFQEEEGLEGAVDALAQETGVEVRDYQGYFVLRCTGLLRTGEIVPDMGASAGKRVALELVDLEEYLRLAGSVETLGPTEVLLYTAGPDYGSDSLTLAGEAFRVKKELQEASFFPKNKEDKLSWQEHYAIVLPGEEALAKAAASFGLDASAQRIFQMECNPVGTQEAVEAFSQRLEQLLSSLPGFAYYVDHGEEMSNDESMYGGLLFIGIVFGLSFLICLLMILYYKQVTEGFEDQRNFEILEKVGMDKAEVQGTIRRQVSMVFYLPMAGALIHVAVGLKMVILLMGAINLFEPWLIRGCAAGVLLVFAALYVFAYHQTARVYYRIVHRAEVDSLGAKPYNS